MNNAELSLTPIDTVLVSACVENFEIYGTGWFYVLLPTEVLVHYSYKNISFV